MVLGLGSNLGDRSAQLASARERLQMGDRLSIDRASSLYESAPIGPEQPNYLNQVVIGRTRATPRALLDACQEIEDALGRNRHEARWGPRTIDLDILVFGDERIDEPDLVVPHPECTQRRFVLVPWAEIDPDGVVVGESGRTVRECLDELERGGEPLLVERWESEKR